MRQLPNDETKYSKL